MLWSSGWLESEPKGSGTAGAERLKDPAPRLYAFLVQHVPKTQAVCLAGYSGNFTQEMVMKPLGHPTGKLAVVVVTSPGNKLLGTVVLTKLPVRFQHTNPF